MRGGEVSERGSEREREGKSKVRGDRKRAGESAGLA